MVVCLCVCADCCCLWETLLIIIKWWLQANLSLPQNFCNKTFKIDENNKPLRFSSFTIRTNPRSLRALAHCVASFSRVYDLELMSPPLNLYYTRCCWSLFAFFIICFVLIFFFYKERAIQCCCLSRGPLKLNYITPPLPPSQRPPLLLLWNTPARAAS